MCSIATPARFATRFPDSSFPAVPCPAPRGESLLGISIHFRIDPRTGLGSGWVLLSSSSTSPAVSPPALRSVVLPPLLVPPVQTQSLALPGLPAPDIGLSEARERDRAEALGARITLYAPTERTSRDVA